MKHNLYIFKKKLNIY